MLRLIALGSAAFLALAGLAPRAHAAVVDTFSFSNLSGWNLSGTNFSGQFTGTVEPDGLIELADLSAFSIQGSFFGGPWKGLGKGELQFFSFNTTGGASSLGFISAVVIDDANALACSGAPSVLDPQCNPGGLIPASTLAALAGSEIGAVFTPDQTTVTLVSSVSTPEPSTWAMMLTGFAGLGLLGAGRASKGRAASRTRRSPA